MGEPIDSTAWQRSFTAPRDGTPIIAYWSFMKRPCVAWFYIKRRDGTGGRWVASHNTAYHSTINDDPLFWMPIPPLPHTLRTD